MLRSLGPLALASRLATSSAFSSATTTRQASAQAAAKRGEWYTGEAPDRRQGWRSLAAISAMATPLASLKCFVANHSSGNTEDQCEASEHPDSDPRNTTALMPVCSPHLGNHVAADPLPPPVRCAVCSPLGPSAPRCPAHSPPSASRASRPCSSHGGAARVAGNATRRGRHLREPPPLAALCQRAVAVPVGAVLPQAVPDAALGAVSGALTGASSCGRLPTLSTRTAGGVPERPHAWPSRRQQDCEMSAPSSLTGRLDQCNAAGTPLPRFWSACQCLCRPILSLLPPPPCEPPSRPRRVAAPQQHLPHGSLGEDRGAVPAPPAQAPRVRGHRDWRRGARRSGAGAQVRAELAACADVAQARPALAGGPRKGASERRSCAAAARRGRPRSRRQGPAPCCRR